MWRYAVIVLLFLVCCNAVEVQEQTDLEKLASLLGDSDARPHRCKRSIDHCAANSNDSCCLHFDCMKNYICCTNLQPKPSHCPTVIQRCCPPPPPPTYCQSNFICCTNAEPKPLICAQVKPRCCPPPPPITPPPPCPPAPTCPPPPPVQPYCQANYICCTFSAVKPLICDQVIPRCCPIPPPPPTRPPPPPLTCPPIQPCPQIPPLPMCQANYICCTNAPAKPFICAQIIPQCCPAIPPPPCPTVPAITCPPPPLPQPFCQVNYKCCSNDQPKPYNCWQVIPRCCPKPPPITCPPPPPTQPPCPVTPVQPYCQRNYICCTNKLPKPYNCPLVVPRCCPKPTCPPIPPTPTCPALPTQKPCPSQPFCQANYICCTNAAVKPAICSQVEPVCCPKTPPIVCPTPIPDPYCKANYVCCTDNPLKPAFCPTVVAKCCPKPLPPTCPPPPVPTFCEKNFICCTNQDPKPFNCFNVVPRCCPKPTCPTVPPATPAPLNYCQEYYQCCTNIDPKPRFCPTVIMRCCPKPAIPPPPTCPPLVIPPTCPPVLPPISPPLAYCQEHYICCTGTGGVKPRKCINVIPRCCPADPPVHCPQPTPTPQPDYCQANYICCTNRTPKPFTCNDVIQRCCPKPLLPPVPPPQPPCPGPCPYNPSPCMGGCPPYYYPGYPGYYPGNMKAPPPGLTNNTQGKRRRRDLTSGGSLSYTTTGPIKPCDCETYTNNSLVTVFVTSASQDSYKLLRNQIQIFKTNLKDAITVEIVSYGNAKSERECEFGEGDCLGNKLLSCASDMSEDDSSIMAFATCIMSSSKLLKDGTVARILAKAQMCASMHSYNWLDLQDCAINVDGELLLKQAGNRQKEIDSSLKHFPAVYFNEESVWSQSSDIYQLPRLLCQYLIDIPAGRALCRRMKFISG